MSLKLSLCIPTAKRPKILGRLLDNISYQKLIPDEIIIIDGVSDNKTKMEVEKRKTAFPNGTLRYCSSELGLTLQRNIGIDKSNSDYICMLDDDVLLESDCLYKMIEFLESGEGKYYAAISAYITNNYGREFYAIENFFNRIKIYDGDLKPGRWLYCGEFLELSSLKPFEGIYDTQFIPAGAAMFRKSVIDQIRPFSNFKFGGEDKHWTLRISQKHKIGVLGNARLSHEHVSIGVRKSPFKQGMISERNLAIILVECDGSITSKRYIVFLFYKALKNLIDTIIILISFRFDMIPLLLGRWVGWFCNFIPPRYFNNHI